MDMTEEGKMTSQEINQVFMADTKCRLKCRTRQTANARISNDLLPKLELFTTTMKHNYLQGLSRHKGLPGSQGRGTCCEWGV